MPLMKSLRSTLPGPPAIVRTGLLPAGEAENGIAQFAWGLALADADSERDAPDVPSHAQVDADPYTLATPAPKRGWPA